MNQLFSLYQFTESNLNRDGIIHNGKSAHSHDYEELIIGVEGGAEHFVDYKTQKLTAPFISFVASGKIHKITPFAIDEKCTVWGLKFKSEFIPETAFQLYSYYQLTSFRR